MVHCRTQIHYPCGLKITQAIRTWRTHVLRDRTLKIEPSACPMHGQTCPTHYDEPVRAALREFHGAMYELSRDELYEALEDLVEKTLGPARIENAGTPGA